MTFEAIVQEGTNAVYHNTGNVLKFSGQPTHGSGWELSSGKRELYYESPLL